MLTKSITYEDFDGNTITEKFNFNLSKSELAKLELKSEGGFKNLVEKLMRERDNKKIVELFEELILMSYGEKSLDGKHFIKNDEVRENFKNTNAYDELFIELMDANKCSEFINGIIPKDISEEISKQG